MQNEIVVRTFFPTIVLQTRLPHAELLNAGLRDLISQKQAEDPQGIYRSNFNGWHSKDDLVNWGGKDIETVVVSAIETCNKHTHDTGMQDGDPRYAWNIQAWANVSPAGASNQYHAHPGAYWSAVYYVDDGGGEPGNLVLQDPRFPMNKMTVPDLVIQDAAGNKEQSEISIKPEPGMLIAFPSWLTHGVRPHQGPRDRISIAMNLIPMPIVKPQG